MFPSLSIVILSLTLTACAGLASFYGKAKNHIETALDAATVGTYHVVVSKDGLPVYQETWQCVATESTLPACKKL